VRHAQRLLTSLSRHLAGDACRHLPPFRPFSSIMSRSRLNCGFLARPPVIYDRADHGMVVIGSSPYSLRVVAEDVRRIATVQAGGQGAGDAAGGDVSRRSVGAAGDEFREEKHQDGEEAGGRSLSDGGDVNGPVNNFDDASIGGAAADGADGGGDGAVVANTRDGRRGDATVDVDASDDGAAADGEDGGADSAGVANARDGGRGDGIVYPAAADDAAASAGAADSSASAPSPPSIAAPAASARRRLLHEGLAGAGKATTPRAARPAARDAGIAAANRLPLEEDTLLHVFLRQLRAAVNLTARMASAQAVSSVCLHGAQVLITVEAFDPIATWLQYKDGAVLALCSCAGVLGLGRSSLRGLPMEFAQMQAALGRSCTCRHASALLRAIDELGQDVAAMNLSDLFTACPALLGPLRDDSDERSVGTITYFAMYSGKRNNVPIYAVFYDDAWTPVVVRPTANKFNLATCCQMPCQTRPWGCNHSKAVNKVTRADASSEAVRAEMERQDALPFGPDGLLNEQEEPATRPPTPAPSRPAVPLRATVPAPKRKRRARNMFPCAAEVAMCDSYSAALDSLRDRKDDRELLQVHAEESFLDCGEERNDKQLTAWAALLYTIRGRLQIHVGIWVCTKGHVVHYDGAQDGLFAASPETVYVRVFLDAVLGICVIARSTMAAASEYLTSLLRNTGAYEEGEHGQARQLLSDACGEFSETLVIPDAAFQCGNCGEKEANGGRFECVLMDGQILAVLQEHILPMLRPGMDAPRANLSITYARAVRNATVRAVIRHRVRSGAADAVALTAEEARKFKAFTLQPFMERPAPPPTPTETSRGMRSPADAEKALHWSAFTVFSTFFSVPNLEAVPRASAETAAAARRAGDTGEGSSGGSDEESVVDMVSPDGSKDGSASDYSSDEINLVAEDGSNDSELGSVDNHLTMPSANADEATTGASGAASGDGRSGVEEDLQALELDVSAPRGSPSGASCVFPSSTTRPSTPPPSTISPSTPPPVGDGTEFLLDAPAGAGDADKPAEVESFWARVPKTRCRWRVPLASVQQTTDEPTENQNPVAVNPADPSSLLTQAAMKAVNAIFNKRRTGDLLPIVNIGAIPLHTSSFNNLLPNKWLDDEVVNGYTLLLMSRNQNTRKTNPAAPKHFFFNSFFYKRLRFLGEYSYDIVRRWTKVDDIFSMSTVSIPIHMAAHWILVVVDIGDDAGVVSIYDSMGSPDLMVAEDIRQWLVDEAADKGKPQRHWTIAIPKCRQQENSDDCGVLMLKNMDYVARGLDPTTISRSTAYYRCRIASELLAGAVGGEG